MSSKRLSISSDHDGQHLSRGIGPLSPATKYCMVVDEVRRVVWFIVEDKVFGLFGFPSLFFGRYWIIIQSEIVAMV